LLLADSTTEAAGALGCEENWVVRLELRRGVGEDASRFVSHLFGTTLPFMFCFTRTPVL